MKTLISPSMLSADFLNLQKDIEMINNSGADWLHLDIMDGTFVPNISYGFPVIEAVSKICKKPLDFHYMIAHPERYIKHTADMGGMMMTIHAEACVHLHRAVNEIRSLGMKAGIALNPSTPLSMVEEILDDIDMVLIMSVNPGFGGQSFIENAVGKVKRLRKMIDERGANVLIQVDGGVNEKTAPSLIEAGADVLVSGSYVFKAADPAKAIEIIRGC